MRNGFGDGIVHRRRKRKGEREGLRADSEEIGAPGNAIIKLAAHEQQQGRIAKVCEQGVALADVRRDGFAVDKAGRKALGSVEKNG